MGGSGFHFPFRFPGSNQWEFLAKRNSLRSWESARRWENRMTREGGKEERWAGGNEEMEQRTGGSKKRRE